jgi:hypothetical protein
MTTGVKIVISCLESSDGQCTRIVISNDSTSVPFTCLGFEKPRLPNANWVSPACFYLLSETIVSGLSCFRWESLQDQENFIAVVKDHDNADLQIAMRMMGPMVSSTEVVDWIQDGPIPNPTVFAGHLTYDGKDADYDWGTLFDWYWVNRNVGGVHMLDLDTAPLAGNRTLVCVGDCVWGWLDDSESNLLYKNIPIKVMPPDTPTLQTWLGVDGTVTTDITEDSSHFWKFEALPSVDVGTLATASFNLGGIGTPVLTTDPDYWEGLENVIVLDALTDSLATGNSTKIPSVQDGTKSLILGGVMQVDDQELVDVNSWLISQHNTSGVDGWNVAMWNAIGGGGDALKLRWVLYQGGVATQCVALIPIVYGVPFAWIANLDWAAGKMKVMTSTPGSYNEVAVADTGDFDVGIDPVRVSGSVVTNIASYLGTQGHLFSYQYSSAIDLPLQPLDSLI